MSIIGNPIMAGVGASVPAASIFVTGLSETDTVTATKGSKTLTGKWVTKTKIVNEPLIPVMTSNTTPSGVASASKMDSRFSAYYAFDGDDSTQAYGSGQSIPWTLQYEFPHTVSINSFSYIASTPSSVDNERTGTHNVQVSLDGSTWETIWSGQTSRGGNNPESGTITLTETKTIKYIRWVTTSMTGGSNPSENVFDFQVYGDVEVQVSGFEISPIRDFGTWTVTATDGVHTKTQDVLVDVITEYEIELLYVPWLYRNGDERESVTGGWNERYVYESGYTGTHTCTKNDDNIELYLYQYGSNMIVTSNKIQANGTLKVKYDAWSTVETSYTGVVVRFGIFASLPNNQAEFRSGSTFKEYSSAVTDEIASIEVSTDGYVAIGIDSGSKLTKMNIRIKEVWIE